MLINFLTIIYKLWKLFYKKMGKAKYLINYFMEKLYQNLYVKYVIIKLEINKHFHV